MAVSQSLSLTESDVSTSGNTSKVRILWQSTQTGESWNGYTRTAKYYVSINGGAEKEYTVSYTLPQNTTKVIVDTTIVVNHKADGTGSVTVRTWMDTDISAGVITQTKSLTLTAIEKQPKMDSVTCNTNYLTGTVTYKYTPRAPINYCRLYVAVSPESSLIIIKTVNLGQKTVVQQTGTFTFSSKELSSIYEKFPSATTVRIYLWVTAYSNPDYTKPVGDGMGATESITLSIPKDVTTLPTMTMTLAPVSDDSSLGSLYVKGLSKVKATFTDGEAKDGASIASYKLTVAGKDYSSPYISDYLSTTGSITVKGTITDSRGYSRSYSQTISVLDYTAPTLDSLSCSSSYFTGTITHKYTPPNNTFYTRCAITLGSTTVKSETHTRASGQQTVSFSFEESELATIYKALPNSASGTLKFTFQAFSDSNYSKQIGSASTKEITLSIPDIDATKPTATLSYAPVSSLASPFNTLYIKGKTKIQASLTSGEGKYGASIASYKVTVGSQSGTSSVTSDFISTSNNITVEGTITDTRGFSRTYTETISPIDYGAPRILPVSGQSSVIAARCNSEGTLDANGTYLLIAAKRSYSKVEASGAQKNYCKIQYRYKIEGGAYSAWTVILATTASSDEVITGALLGGELDTMHTYVVQVQVIDDIGEKTTTTIFVPTERVYMHKAGSMNSVGIGKYAEDENTVDIAEEMTTIFRGEVQFKSEAWVELPLGTNVTDSTVNSGRWGGTGVFYRVCAGGKHIYVAFNVSFTTSSSTVRAESYTIPYPPTYDVYALCPVGFSDGSRGIATVSISPKGRVNIYAVHKLPGATLSTGETVNWIDGYIDYWT